MDFGGLLDAYIYNERTPAGKRRAEQERAQEYSRVWTDTEAQLAEQGLKADHNPMRTAELLLRSGNPTAIKAGSAIMQQYHAGKTGDIKEHEYTGTLSEEEAQRWAESQAKAGVDVIGAPLKVHRNDGSVGYSIVRRDPNSGGVYMQDLGADAYIPPKVMNVGGGMQSLYRDGRGQLQYGPQGDAIPPQGYQNVPPELEAEFNEFLRQKAIQQQQQQQPDRVPQQPRPVPRAQPQQVYGGREQFLENTGDVAATEARANKLGAASGKNATELGLDQNKIYQHIKNRKVMFPEIDNAIRIIVGHGSPDNAPGAGNWATGGIMEIDAIKNLIPWGNRFPSVTEMVGTDAQALAEHLNVIRTNISFDRLQEMRDASPTGGALGQVTEMEHQMLKDSLASLNQKNRPEVMIRNLQKVKYHYERVENLAKIGFLLKHKYKVSAGRTGYDDFMDAQRKAIIQVYGENNPQAKEFLDMVTELQFGPIMNSGPAKAAPNMIP